jgi:hypothetical protein
MMKQGLIQPFDVYTHPKVRTSTLCNMAPEKTGHCAPSCSLRHPCMACAHLHLLFAWLVTGCIRVIVTPITASGSTPASCMHPR